MIRGHELIKLRDEYIKGEVHIITKTEVFERVKEAEKKYNMRIEDMIKIDSDKFDFRTKVTLSLYKDFV